MADVSWKAPLKPDQSVNPILNHQMVDLPADIFVPTDEQLTVIFDPDKHSLKTWGRAPGVKNGTEPHWIGVCKQTPLHTDRAYPRYTHHLMLRVDNFILRGVDLTELPLVRGLFFTLDTHSPHQLLAKDKLAKWYLAVSMDSKFPLNPEAAIPQLIDYARSAPLHTPEILQPNVGGRPRKVKP